MSSEDPIDGYYEEGYNLPENLIDINSRRRDSLWNGFWKWTLVMAIIGIAAVAVCYYTFGAETIAEVVDEYWPLAICPLLGWLLGSWAVNTLYRPSGKVIIALDTDTWEVRVVFVPDRMFPFFTQVGNNVAFHTPLGTTVYIAKAIDTDFGVVDYGWVQEMNALVVFTRMEAFNRWTNFTEELLKENSKFKDKSLAIGLAYSRRFLTKQLNDLAAALGMIKPDYSQDPISDGPEEDEVTDDE